jgi:hypothetical protein
MEAVNPALVEMRLDHVHLLTVRERTHQYAGYYLAVSLCTLFDERHNTLLWAQPPRPH